ncbi:cytochrome o ubiquinol oxidase subunit III [Candidatus Protochlamydia phocaeensis]|uniref:cytochrome o ubiquinol oxidase subunit III n=1 Tax=Candidatus Protochlamydia phocaeensis TaxID=1414722 RepID=UPI0008386F8E|nr:cytochrome o ubiquinol oxidase subunit III [Candidatus Protochlamydia phocaeensis]
MESEANLTEDTKVFGFWIYLMTDLIIFAVLFAAFAVLRNSNFGGPSGRELFHLPLALAETLILLTSSFTCSLAMIAAQQKQKTPAIFWFLMTFALGMAFLFIEISEFSRLIDEGAGWQRSAFLSSFFTLVGTHGLHISIGLLWMIVAMVRIALRPLIASSLSRIFRMALFWHFLDIVWIFIFTVVYGMEYLT